MASRTSVVPWIALSMALAAASAAAAAPPAGRSAAPPAEPIVAWNELVLAVAEAEDGFLTLKGVRTAAILHLAVHDALNAIEPRYATWLQPPRTPGADPTAAAAEAAFAVASDQYPDRRPRFTAERDRWLARVADGAAKAAGIALGRAAAAAVLASRRHDRWDGDGTYEWQPPAPGVYAELGEHSGTPAGFVFGAGWARAEPFTLGDASRFRAPPPPPIDSAAYSRAFAEVKEVGARHSATRTADETHLAMWWKEFVESSHNRLARRLVREERLDPWRAARLFALLETSIYDAYVAVFAEKMRHNHWRPYTAIRRAADDGNPATEPDPDWDNLHGHTYAFPSYPSAHGTACAAVATVLAETFGPDRPVTMTVERVDRAGPLSEEVAMQPATRTFASFAAAAEECAISRVYLGIHFRYDSEAGTELGRRIGQHVVEGSLRPLGDRRRP